MPETVRDPREGRLVQVNDQWQLRFVRRLSHAREKVWRALTEEQHLASWFPTTIKGELKPGAPLRFAFRGEELPPEHGEVLACEPPSLLEFTWYGPPDGTTQHETTRFELEPDGDGCILTFSTTYKDVGKSARDAAGWHVCFDLLELELDGHTSAASSPERWKPLNRLYAERFGPDATTVGPPPEMKDYA